MQLSPLEQYFWIPTKLDQVKKLFFTNEIGLDDANQLISNWRDDEKYVVLEPLDENGERTCLYVKASKRGNGVYRYRVIKRHRDLIDFCKKNPVVLIEPGDDGNYYSNILKATATVDIKRFDRNTFNKKLCSYYVDLFTKRIRNKYPGVQIARTYEVCENGYLHVNFILVFPNHRFKVRYHISKRKNSKGKPITSWRLDDYKLKQFFDDLWEPGFTDIRAIENSDDLVEYSLKYHIKYFTNKEAKEKQNLTLSVLSLFNKRSISIPDSFKEAVYKIIKSKRPVDDITEILPRLDNKKHNSLKYTFLGIISADKIPFQRELWYFETLEPPPIDDFDFVKIEKKEIN